MPAEFIFFYHFLPVSTKIIGIVRKIVLTSVKYIVSKAETNVLFDSADPIASTAISNTPYLPPTVKVPVI